MEPHRFSIRTNTSVERRNFEKQYDSAKFLVGISHIFVPKNVTDNFWRALCLVLRSMKDFSNRMFFGSFLLIFVSLCCDADIIQGHILLIWAKCYIPLIWISRRDLVFEGLANDMLVAPTYPHNFPTVFSSHQCVVGNLRQIGNSASMLFVLKCHIHRFLIIRDIRDMTGAFVSFGIRYSIIIGIFIILFVEEIRRYIVGNE